jgi:hypothetical protein
MFILPDIIYSETVNKTKEGYTRGEQNREKFQSSAAKQCISHTSHLSPKHQLFT